jgi:hypothetical protein
MPIKGQPLCPYTPSRREGMFSETLEKAAPAVYLRCKMSADCGSPNERRIAPSWSSSFTAFWWFARLASPRSLG